MESVINSEIVHVNKLERFFFEKESFSAKELKGFFEAEDSDLSDTTINWRIRKLVEKGIIKRIGHGVYAMGESQNYVPSVSHSQKKLFKKIKTAFPYSGLCVWDTSMLNSLMLHQPFQFMTVVETDNDSVQSVFYSLQESRMPAFLGTDYDIIDRYRPPEKRIVIVKSLVSEAPIQESDGIMTITLEKVLVDLFCDGKLFSAYQGNERSIIFKNAFKEYTINQNKLMRYARRRGQKDSIRAYLDELGLLRIENRNSL